MSEVLYHGDLYQVDLNGDQASNENFHLHTHESYEIFLFLDGDSRYIVEQNSYSLKSGDMIIIRKHEMHRIFHNTPKFYQRIVLMVSPAFFERFNCPEYEGAFFKQPANIGHKIDTKLVHSSGLFDAFVRLRRYSNDFTVSGPVTDAIVTEILYLINTISTYSSADQTTERVRSVIAYINEHFTEEITLDQLQERFFISKYHLCRVFRQATGLTVHQYLRRKRITLVKELTTEGKNLTEAALLAGFNDYSAFYRAYKGEFEVSPEEDF